MEPHIIFFLLGLLQIIIIGIGSWNLTTTIKLQNRMTQVETLLTASMIEDLKDLKGRVRDIENRCITRHIEP